MITCWQLPAMFTSLPSTWRRTSVPCILFLQTGTHSQWLDFSWLCLVDCLNNPMEDGRAGINGRVTCCSSIGLMEDGVACLAQAEGSLNCHCTQAGTEGRKGGHRTSRKPFFLHYADSTYGLLGITCCVMLESDWPRTIIWSPLKMSACSPRRWLGQESLFRGGLVACDLSCAEG